MSRTDFEAAYIERYGHRPRGWNNDFQVYQDAHANGAWFGWQARAAGIEAKAAHQRQQAREVVMPTLVVKESGEWGDAYERGFKAALREFARLNKGGSHE